MTAHSVESVDKGNRNISSEPVTRTSSRGSFSTGDATAASSGNRSSSSNSASGATKVRHRTNSVNLVVAMASLETTPDLLGEPGSPSKCVSEEIREALSSMGHLLRPVESESPTAAKPVADAPASVMASQSSVSTENGASPQVSITFSEPTEAFAGSVGEAVVCGKVGDLTVDTELPPGSSVSPGRSPAPVTSIVSENRSSNESPPVLSRFTRAGRARTVYGGQGGLSANAHLMNPPAKTEPEEDNTLKPESAEVGDTLRRQSLKSAALKAYMANVSMFSTSQTGLKGYNSPNLVLPGREFRAYAHAIAREFAEELICDRQLTVPEWISVTQYVSKFIDEHEEELKQPYEVPLKPETTVDFVDRRTLGRMLKQLMSREHNCGRLFPAPSDGVDSLQSVCTGSGSPESPQSPADGTKVTLLEATVGTTGANSTSSGSSFISGTRHGGADSDSESGDEYMPPQRPKRTLTPGNAPKRPYKVYAYGNIGRRPYMEDQFCVIDHFDTLTEAKWVAPPAAPIDSIDGNSERSIESSPKLCTANDVPDSSLFCGVFDGHNGVLVSRYASSCVPYYVANHDEMSSNMGAALKDSFLEADARICEHSARMGTNVGSTATVVVVRNGQLYVANLGDSAAVLSHGGVAQELSIRHKPSDDSERERIEAADGQLVMVHGALRVGGILAVSRALGDYRFKKFVIGEPAIVEHTLIQGDEFLVMGSDGVFDVLDPQECVDFVHDYCRRGEHPLRDIAEHLVKRALELDSADNITAIVVFFEDITRLVMQTSNADGSSEEGSCCSSPRSAPEESPPDVPPPV